MRHFPENKARKWFFLVIVVVAIFFRFPHLSSVPPGLYPDEAVNGTDALEALESGHYKLYYPNNNGREGLYNSLTAFFFKIFGAKIWTLRLLAAISGTITVIALYLLAKEFFSWQIGALAGFLTAVSFWSVNFSRIAFRASLAPALITLAIYFFWKGMRGKHLINFFFGGLAIGLGFYTYIAFRVSPLIILCGFLAYWHFLKKDYDREEYRHARDRLVRGLVLFFITALLVGLPLGLYYWLNPADFLGRTSQISIFSQGNPLGVLGLNFLKTLGMFNFVGDHNWRHNLSGQPLLFWPIGLLFAAGFLRSFIKLFRRWKSHGHLAPIPLTLICWFLLGLLPVILSSEGIPHALRALMVMPVVFLWAGEGAWWFFSTLKNWYGTYDKHPHEAALVSTMVLLVFLASLGLFEYNRYFKTWAQNPNTISEFTHDYVKIAETINSLPPGVKKYVIAERGDVLIDGIPVMARTVMFLTKTYSSEGQKEKNITYLTPEQFQKVKSTAAASRAKIFYLR